MSEHEIKIPFPTRDARLNLGDVADWTRALDGEDRTVARRILSEAATTPGVETAGDVIDWIEQASPEERRRIADEAREACGLVSYSQMEKNQALARATRWPPRWAPTGPPRDERGEAMMRCAAPDCKAAPTHEDGSLRAVRDRKFWCPRHRDLAGPDDHLPPPTPRVRLDANGFPQSVDEDEFLARQYEKVEAEGPTRRAAKAAELARLAKLEEEYRRTVDRPPLNGLPWPRSRS